jgi:1-acyl-sn-glycerol-3-phosphate acyltransferase
MSETTPRSFSGPALEGAGFELDRDPFLETGLIDPLERRLDELERRRPARLRAVRRAPAPAAPTPLRRPVPPRPRSTPALSEIELPDDGGIWERLLPERARRALASIAHLFEGEGPYDRFGFSPDVTRRALPWFHALYKLYFRVESRGHEHLPERGRAVLAANHGGLLPFDGAMTVIDVLLHTDPPRLARAIVDRWAGELPFVNVFYARVGQVIGTRENFADLLDDDQLVLVFPEGIEGIRKTVAHRYRLQSFHVGFVEQALRARAPIVPMAVIGSDDQTPILYDLKPIARALRLPVAPITPTFPWLGPLGLLPYPVRYKIVYGEPLRFHERFGPEGADDARLVQYLARQVRSEVQRLVDRNRA